MTPAKFATTSDAAPTPTRSTLCHLECSQCRASHDSERLQHLSTCCSRPLLACYDLAKAAQLLTPAQVASRQPHLWRYAELLPLRDHASIFFLGEGRTPLHPAPRLARRAELAQLWIKNEALNPTGSFKDRGLAVAVSRAVELGARRLAIPSAGNAAGAAAAYGAAAGLPVDVFMPADVPPLFRAECEVLGATVHLVDGLITDCGRHVAEGVAEHGWFDLSTLKEPYRLEGKKTLGYDLWLQLDGELPDVIVYPTGGGTGLVGMWKAFAELRELGWLAPDARLPRMVSVQSEGCAPIVRAFQSGAEEATPWEGAATVADGLRVPAAVGDRLILSALRESGGTAVAVPDADMLEEARSMGAATGIFPAPEGAACLAAAKRLRESGWFDGRERVVLFNTGSGLKYAHLWAT
jgi:threonine synthase